VPREIGETVEVAYLEEAPHRPLSPARLRDVGFIEFLPYVLAAIVVYALILLVDFRRRGRASELPMHV
jgi:hypothetical protein